jgi:membrane-associated phospholipid phosphatase
MKNKDERPIKEIRLPELEIHGVWEKIINSISQIDIFYWIIGIAIFLSIIYKLMPYHIWTDLYAGLKSQAVLVSLLLVFSLVAISLVWSTGQKIDVWVLLFFNMNGKRTPWLDSTMLGITQIGNGVFAMIIAFIVFLSVNHIFAYEIALGTLSLWLAVELIKVLIHRTRPYLAIKKIRIVGSRAGGPSFPSGHTSQAFFLATLMIHYYSVGLWIAFVIYGVALLVGITRIYVGMHYPRDVIGGAIFGTCWGIFGVVVNNYIWIAN